MALLLNANDSVSRSYNITKPSPLHPIVPSECGERTENLFSSSFSANYNIDTNGEVVPYTQNSSRCATLTPIDVSNLTTVTFSFTNTSSNDNKRFIYALFDGSTLVSRETYKLSGSSINVSRGNKLYLCIYSSDTNIDSSQTITNIMLTAGSTAPTSYIPYGYKLPLTSGSTPVDIYLGESQTTRRIKKLVLTGDETWSLYNEVNVWQFYTNNIISGLASSSCMSNIAEYGATASTRGRYNYGAYLVSSGRGIAFQMIGSKDAFVDVASWKAYLAEQYSNGTPVTVWYVLATEETGTLNEPLRQIGDYADTIDSEQTSAQIPTSAGSTTISWAGQGLAPSQFDSIQEWVDISTYTYTNGEWVADN